MARLKLMAIAAILLLFGCAAVPQEQQGKGQPEPSSTAMGAAKNISSSAANSTPANSAPVQSNVSTPVIAPDAPNSSSPANDSSNFSTEIEMLHPQRLQVYFYYSTYCPYSMAVKPYVESQQQAFENSTEWHSFNVWTQQGYYFFDKMAIERNLSSKGRVVPIIVAGGRMLAGIGEINESLRGLLLNYTGE